MTAPVPKGLLALPAAPIASAPRDGTGILAYGRHVTDNGRSWSIGDHWWAIIQWDVWRDEKWVFAKDGRDLWGPPSHWAPLVPPADDPAPGAVRP